MAKTDASRTYAKYVAAYGTALGGGSPINAAFDWEDEPAFHAAVALGIHDGKNNKEPRKTSEVLSMVSALVEI